MPASHRHLTRKRFALLVSFGLALIIIGLFVSSRLDTRRQVERAIGDIRAAGQPATLQELQDSYAPSPIAGEQGAALDRWLADTSISKVFGSAAEEPQFRKLPLLGDTSLPPPGVALAPETRALVNTALRTMGPRLPALHALLATTNFTFRFPIQLTNGMNTLLPHVSQMKSASRWLALQSVVALEAGDREGATRAVLDGFRLSRTLAEEPTLISQLVRFSVLQQGLNSTQRLLDTGGLDGQQLENLRLELQLARPSHAIFRGMTGERCMGLELAWFAESGSPAGLNLNGAVNQSGTLPSFLRLAHRMSGLADRDALFYIQSLNRIIGISTNSVSARLQFSNDPKAMPRPSRLLIVSALLGTALQKPFQKEATMLANCAAMDAALAVEQFRLNERRLPVDLAQLGAPYFAEAPRDPRDESPLRLVPTANGYRIEGQAMLLEVAWAATE